MQSDLHEIAAIYFRALDQDEELDTRAYIEKNVPDSVRDAFEVLKNRKLDPAVEMPELNEEIIRSVAFMRREKKEYDKTELQSLLEDRETSAESLREYETMLNHALEERRLLDMLIEDVNLVDFKNGKPL